MLFSFLISISNVKKTQIPKKLSKNSQIFIKIHGLCKIQKRTKMNVILLGCSNSVMVNGLQKGIRLGIDELNVRIENGEFADFAKSDFGKNLQENSANFSSNLQENSRILNKNTDESLPQTRERERE